MRLFHRWVAIRLSAAGLLVVIAFMSMNVAANGSIGKVGQ